MPEWRPYEWPVLGEPDPMQMEFQRSITDRMLDWLSELFPGDFFDWGASDPDWGLDGDYPDPWDGLTRPYDGGDGSEDIDGGAVGDHWSPGPLPGFWIVVPSRVDGQTDIESLADIDCCTSGPPRINGVWVPSGLTAAEDDVGSGYLCEDGRVVFCPLGCCTTTTTTTAAPGDCPITCAACANTYYRGIDQTCDGVTCTGTIEMGPPVVCYWDSVAGMVCSIVPLELIGGFLTCGSGYWWHTDTRTWCSFVRPGAGVGDCPDGVYDLAGDACGNCPPQVTVYA